MLIQRISNCKEKIIPTNNVNSIKQFFAKRQFKGVMVHAVKIDINKCRIILLNLRIGWWGANSMRECVMWANNMRICVRLVLVCSGGDDACPIAGGGEPVAS